MKIATPIVAMFILSIAPALGVEGPKLILPPVEEPKPPAIGEWGVIVTKVMNYACRSVADLTRYRELFRSGDMLAATRFLSEHHCKWLETDSKVFVENYAGKYVCLRPEGETDCLWLDSATVETKEEIAKQKAKAQETIDEMNKQFDLDHPECVGWKENKKGLPEYCY
jgi:hypothetical protein